MPPGAVYLSLTYWTRLYGLICMEVFGQLHWALDDAGAYFACAVARDRRGPRARLPAAAE